MVQREVTYIWTSSEFELTSVVVTDVVSPSKDNNGSSVPNRYLPQLVKSALVDIARQGAGCSYG